MRKIIIFIAVIAFSSVSTINAQECDSLVNVCHSYLSSVDTKEKSFISDGQVYKAFVDADQSAEFRVTFYGGSTYRIASTAGTKDDYVIFNVYDQERNLLFTNKDHKNSPYWDFKIDNTLDCYVEAYLDIEKKVSGCLVVLIGFKK